MATKKSTPAQLLKSMGVIRLYGILQDMVGKKCWKAVFAYGDDLHLHIGARIPYEIPNMAGKKGSWVLRTCGTSWVLVTPHGSISSQGGQQLKDKIKVLENSPVTGFGLSVPDGVFSLTFGNNCRLLITPTANDRKAGLPYWELFTPARRFIAFGPGNRWSYSRSDMPPPRQLRSSAKARMSLASEKISQPVNHGVKTAVKKSIARKQVAKRLQVS